MEWEAHSLATARPTPLAAPVMRAVAFLRKTAVGEAIVLDSLLVLGGLRETEEKDIHLDHHCGT